MKKLFISLIICLNALLSFGQTDNYGTEFWTGFMSNYNGGAELRLFIAAKQTTDVTISVPLMGYSKKINVLKDSVVLFTMPNSVAEISSSEVVEKTGIHIVSDYPIAITAMNLFPHTTDATVVFPQKNVPVNATYITGHPSKGSSNEFLIVSTENGAKVEIIPTAKLKSTAAFTPFYITLDQGEVYQVRAASLDGSSVKCVNGKKIIVYTGDKCSNFPCGACDHQVEQVFPNIILDTAYYAIPHWGHTKGYTVKVVSIDTTIWIKVNGKSYRIGRKDSALVLDVPRGDSVLHISGPRPFSCFQFLKGAGCNGYATSGWGDPSILQIFSTRYMGQKSTFNAVNSTKIQHHLVSILINTSSKNDVYLDGSKIAANEFVPVSHNKNFSYAMLKITLGVHTIYCQGGHLAYCYGLGPAESYLYNAGFSLPNFEIDIKDSTLSYECKTNTVNMRFEAKLEGAIKEYHWDFGDGSPFDTTKIVTHKYPVGQDFTIKLWAVGTNNKKDSVIKKYNFKWPEFNPIFDKLLCDESYTFEEKNPFFKNFKWHDASTSSSYKTTKNEKIWVTATDTSGYCKFSDTAQIFKVDILSKVKVDTISNCHLNNLFKFSDSSYVKNDQILYKAWVFPGGVTLYDTTDFYYHFRQPGKLMVYLDIYPVNAACKARIEIPVTVNWNTDIDAYIDKEKYCNGEVATIKDSSYSCCQKVKNYYWELDDGTKVQSSTGLLKTKVYYNYKNSTGIKNFKYITETEQGCRDTLKSGLIVWPAAKSNFDIGTDSVKCLALSRWTFTHTVDESIAGKYSMFWNFGNGKTGTQNQYKNFRYTDTGTYKVTFTTTTAIGCVDSTTKYVKAINNAIAKFSIKDTIQCLQNNSFTVIDSSKGFALNYIWNFGNGNFSYNAKPNDEHYALPGNYKIKLKVVSNFPGCFNDSVTHNINVLKHPEADFTFNSDTLCVKNNSVVLTDNSKFYNGKYKLYWNYGGSQDSSFLPFAIHFNDTGKYKVTLIAKDSTNCSDTISKSVNLKPEPIVKMSINDTIQCFGVNNFKVNSPTGSSVKNRIWTLNNTILSGTETQKDISNLTPNGFYKITLTEENVYGCKDSVSRFIEVLPPLKADFSINQDTQCFDKHSVDFKGKSTVPKDIISLLSYKYGSNLIGTTADITNYKFLTSGDKVVRLLIKTEEGCKDSIDKSLHLVSGPVANFISDSVCIGESVTLTSVQTSGSPIFLWTWNMADGSRTEPAFASFKVHTYKNPGIYYPQLSYSDKKGCYGSFNGSPIVVYPLPKPGFTIKKLASDDQYTFVKLTPDNFGYSSYLWSFPDGNKNTKDTPTIKVSNFFKDRIYLTVQNAFGCSDTQSMYFYIFPELTNLYHENVFSPNGDQLNEVFRPYNIEGAKDFELMIFNRWGEQLYKTNDPKAGWNGTYKNEPVQNGIYIFTVEFMYADGNRYSTRGNVTVVR